MVEFIKKANSLFCALENEFLEIEPWGRNAMRVRCTPSREIKQDWISALINKGDFQAEIIINENEVSIQNGHIKINLSSRGELSFINTKKGQEFLKEKAIHPLSIPARAYKDLKGDLYHIDCSFEAYDDEHIYGLGQHQHGRLDQKGCVIELIQRNTEISIPFFVSSKGYGFLWNNPAIGRVELGNTATHWVAEAAPQIDYWITAGDTPAEIMSNYADVSGHAPTFPEWASGFWQSKLRYASQAEVEAVAREYHERNLPLSVIVVDFFHWTRQGDWQFDPQFWPDPAGMVKRLQKLGIKVMVSFWPTVNRLSNNFAEMWHKKYIIRNKSGSAAQMYFVDVQAEEGIYQHYYDATHPGARKFIWERAKKGYYKHGIDVFWLDACEPEMSPFMPENLRFYAGDGEAVANSYPKYHVQGFYEGFKEEGEEAPLFLCRSAWAGSQQYGAAVWSGDIQSTFSALRAQVTAGLNMGLSGIPWWTCDIGGFRGGESTSHDFRELIIRWFQYGAFCPIFRLHGHRLPNTDDFSGGPNEVWSFGEEAYQIIQRTMALRERMRPYIMEQMAITSETGTPLMRALFVDFPSDAVCYQIADQYMFGTDLLVAPVLDAKKHSRKVYLPDNSYWKEAWTDTVYKGGQWITVDAPLDQIPLFLRGEVNLPIKEKI
ncbi:MAG: glycoside hydrolase family 31 protein [Anaerolineaceae bacterium]|nr:glycoside hydrolase family 31 protein [Anaerolineaceae bacterium]